MALKKLKTLLFQDVSALADPATLKAALSGNDRDLDDRLWQALATDDVSLLARILKLGAHPARCSAQGLTPLHAAIDRPELLAMLLASPLARAAVDEPNAQGFTALAEAAAAGQGASVDLLLAAGARVSATGPRGVSVLHRAATQDNVNVLRVLFEAGANWLAPDVDGQTPLDVLERHRPHAVNAWRRRLEARAEGPPPPAPSP